MPNRRDFVRWGMLGAFMLGTSRLSAHTVPIPTLNVPNPLVPPRLKQGDKVAVVGLAGAVWNTKVISGFKHTLKEMGLTAWLAPSVYCRSGYLSGTDEERLKDLKQALLDPEIKAVFCIRGGWGTARLMEHIDWTWFTENPKIIIGFSDITFLINAINHRTGLVSYHGPVGNSGWNAFTVDALKKALFETETLKLGMTPSQMTKAKISRPGTATGTLIGGNLCVFVSMLGSPYFPDCHGKILVLEEIGEEPYRIDRMLTSLRLAGVFSQISGLILGQFTDCSPASPQQSYSLSEVLQQHFGTAAFPILSNAPLGHTENKWTLPLGVEATLDADLGTLTYLNPVVK